MYSLENDRLFVFNESTELRRKHLLLGNSKKTSRSIGRHGEGMKLAFLVSARLGLNMEVQSGDEVWTSGFEYSDDYEEDVLVIYINERLGNDITIVSIDCSDLTCYIPDHDYGAFIGEGNCYIEGLFICKMEDFEYDVFFRAGEIVLDRDRRIISQWDVSSYVTRNLTDTLLDDAIAGKPHINIYAANNSLIKKQWKEKYGDSIAVPISKQDSYTGIIVPDSVAEIIDNLPEKGEGYSLDDWIEEYECELSSVACEDFNLARRNYDT